MHDREWTEWIGLRRAVTRGVILGSLVFGALTALYIVAAPFLNTAAIGSGRRRGWLLGIIALALGAAAKWLVWKRVLDGAGFTGWIVGVIGWLAIVAPAALASWIAWDLQHLHGEPAFELAIGIAIVAGIWIIYDVLTD